MRAAPPTDVCFCTVNSMVLCTPPCPLPQKYEDDASEELQTAIWEAFGDYDTLKTNFSAAAAGVFGSG